jgi:hypothetical protein
MAIKYSTAAREAQLTDLNTEIGTNAYIRIYSGTRPANVAASITGTLLAELRGNASGFGTVGSGALTASAITADSSADATGTATHFRIFKSDGTTAVFDGTVGLSGCDCNIDALPVAAGAEVTCSSMTYTANRG